MEATEGKSPRTEKETEKDSQMVKSLLRCQQLGNHDAEGGFVPFEFLLVSQRDQSHFIVVGALLHQSMFSALLKDRSNANFIFVDDRDGSIPGGRHGSIGEQVMSNR